MELLSGDVLGRGRKEEEGGELERLRAVAERELGVPARLHDYQWEGVTFLHGARAALLGDEMGLGKTVQTAVALSLVVGRPGGVSRALIVAPASLTVNWVLELARWAPSMTVRRVTGSAAAREAAYLLPIPVLVASYEQIRSDGLDRVPRDAFGLVILDEAQRIKNRGSATALACRLLPRKRAWALSATPLENSPDDVRSILAFLEGGALKESSLTEIKEKLGSIMLRRRKADVRADLPEVLVQDLMLDLCDTQRQR